MARSPEWSAWRADVRRYPRGAVVRNPALWAIGVYRFGHWAAGRRGLVRIAVMGLYGLLHLPVELLTGISIPRHVEIGPGLRVVHFGLVVVHSTARIGANCTFLHGVTIGIREEDRAPVIEDDVVLGAYAQVLGGVRVGRGAKVGAMSVVIEDVPPGASVAGSPARVVGRHRSYHRRMEAAGRAELDG